MKVRIETLERIKLAGISKKMSLQKNSTFELWSSFQKTKKEIKHAKGNDLYSIQFYPKDYFENFNPEKEFEKWAATEVTTWKELSTSFSPLELKKGLYAVFEFKGGSSEAPKIFDYIYNDWLPNSEYDLDNRPHFEILGPKYFLNSPDSEEEIWIPIKLKL